MKTKKLFILTSDAGDGSYHPVFTFNEAWIEKRDNEDGEYGDLGVDGDGFHYTTINVPVECTLESLGVDDCAE